MRICVVSNHPDRRCGFAKYSYETVTALRRAGHDVLAWDGTYPACYARREAGNDMFLPPDVTTYDVVHLIWHAATLNHYAGMEQAGWPKGPLLSFWNGGPSNCSCPFIGSMQVKWSCYPLEGHLDHWYPILDWVEDLPEPDPQFTVGATSVRGDGVSEIRAVCEKHGWATNLPQPDQWLTLEDEVRRLARSTVNVCWYNTPPLWKDRAGAPATALGSGRPLLINEDDLLAHLHASPDLYHGRRGEEGPNMEASLLGMYRDWQAGQLRMPDQTRQLFSWTNGVAAFEEGWAAWRG